MKTWERASAGCHQALAAHQSATSPSRFDSGIAKAVDRQTRAMRELSQGAFPQPPDNEPTAIQTARVQRRRQAAATETAALRRARQERAAREPGAAGLRTTT